MAKDNEQFAREKELAREYEKKMAAREQAVRDKVTQQFDHVKTAPYEVRTLSTLFNKLYIPAFTDAKYQKPSEFFRAEMPWIYEYIIYARFHDAFDHAVDSVRDYPYSVSWSRRSYRSDHYLSYADRIGRILMHFRDECCLDADIRDVLTGHLPEDARCYLKSRRTRAAGFAPEVLAYELDKDDPGLEAIVTDIVNGDSEFSVVSHDLIQGIVMSRNPRMHQLLCRLLLAAKLQEGLRQAICEKADWGTKEAFHAILSAIAEHDLIRYSSVKRAVGTWIGVISEETRDLDRISGKSVELICRCLMDTAFREECLASGDAMAIHIALWSATFDNIQKGFGMLDRLIEQGTHHQVLTAGYFVATLDNEILRQRVARKALKTHRDRYDILAAYLPSFLPYPRIMAHRMSQAQAYPEVKHYFDDNEEAKEFSDWLFEMFQSMQKKELVFDPCIFPWYCARLKKSELIEKSMILAAAMMDQERIDKLCPYIGACEAFARDLYFKMMTMGEKTPAVRKAIIDGLQDKSADTRKAAFERAKGMELTPEEYRQIEQMLRLRYDDLRRNGMELLMKQPDGALEATVRRLLASSGTAMRTAGLDMVTQLGKREDRAAVAEGCLEAVRAISEPTTQEKILIDALMPEKEEPHSEPLFTEADRYEPVIGIDAYAKVCIGAFMELFPQSRLEQQVLAGEPVLHNAVREPIVPCAAAATAQKNIRSLSDAVIAHEKETFMHFMGRELPIGTDIRNFQTEKTGGGRTVPGMEFWKQWREENQITLSELFGMLIACNGQPGSSGYLLRCGKYVADLYGAGFENRVTVRYEAHVQGIVQELIREEIGQEQAQQLAMALGIWIARCLPDEMLIGGRIDDDQQPEPQKSVPAWASDEQLRININAKNQMPGSAGHFVAHPQINRIFYELSPKYSENLKHRIPVLLNVYERTFASTAAYMAERGHPAAGRVTLLLNQIYREEPFLLKAPKLPDAAVYLYARHFGLISDRSLYHHLMAPGFFKKALELVTAVRAMKPAEGDVVSSRTFSIFSRHSIRRAYEDFVGRDAEPDAEWMKLIELCRRTADILVSVVVDAELNRGDMPADYSGYVTGIHMLSGMETFVKILSALGKDALDRSVYYWGNSPSKRGNLSFLLARCAPKAGDNAEKLKQMLKGTDITEKRLIEAALYSPAWIDIIGEYLNLPGFNSACYYFMAHMNERFDEQKKAIIARFTPLSEDELNLGAFDVAWFHSAYDQLGEKKFNLIYDAAKYISDGGKHTRARKYADAALGRLAVEETEAAIKDKRNKDLLMAYAIIPLTGEDDLIHRYLYLQQFLKESRQFGSQRSTSEKKSGGDCAAEPCHQCRFL